MKTLLDIQGVRVGHATDEKAKTGCTVVLTPEGAVAGVDVRGSAPGTREIALLSPMNLVKTVHGVLLTGGSAFGLAAGDGIMRYLSERGIGFPTGVTPVPIVSGAVLFDLGVGKPDVYPDSEMGYRACQDSENNTVLRGRIGAGTGATVGKILGQDAATPAGLGTSCIELPGGILVAALFAVNAFGDIWDPEKNEILAGAKTEEGFLNTEKFLLHHKPHPGAVFTNTTIGVVITNAKLNKEEVNKVARLSHHGLVKTIRPVHTMYDGDTIFALATGEKDADVTQIGVAAGQAVALAILNSID